MTGLANVTLPPPTTAWGALLRAADLLEACPGLARISTLQQDYLAGKLDPFAALQDALWVTPDNIPRVDGGIPADKNTGCPYWAAVKMFDLGLGGTGELWSPAIDKLLEDPAATAASVAALMRKAAGGNWRGAKVIVKAVPR